jgi:prepilin-type N-terminal cleavage/methylation domain-containing protein
MKKGFTMIEVIVSIALTGIILALLTMIMNSASREYSVGKSRLYNSSTARAVQLEIEDSIKEASFATCSFDNLGLGKASGDTKRLIYVKPQKPGTSPYMLVLKNKSSSGWELHRMYCDNNINSKTYVNEWKQQGTSTVHKACFAFAELTPEEMSMVNSQVDSYMGSHMLSGLTKLSNPPTTKIEIEDLQNYYKKDNPDEYLAYTSSIDEASLVYLENIKYEYCTSMSTKVDNLVMDGIDDIGIIQNGRDSFDVIIRCGEEEYSSSVIMRSYARGIGLEKK